MARRLLRAAIGAMLRDAGSQAGIDMYNGKLSFIFTVAVALSFIGAWWVGQRYRAAMRVMMSAPQAVRSERRRDDAPPPTPSLLPAVGTTLGDNRRAHSQLALLLITLSALIALSLAALEFGVAMEPGTFSWKRLPVLALVYMWPVLPALALAGRWSRRRLASALALWCALCFAVVLWRSIEPRPIEVLAWLAIEIGPPLVLVALLCLGSVNRAIAPWLLPPFVVLVWSSIAGIDLLGVEVQREAGWLRQLSAWLGANAVFALAAILPWLLAWWPLKWLARALARAYAAKLLSELLVLFTAVWGVSMLAHALSSASALGLAGLVMLAPLAWIPLVILPWQRLHNDAGRAPTLLVLRVYQQDAQVQRLFDDVIERWRLSGNTVLIAGTDLALRRLGADDIFTFLDGRLGTRFVRGPTDVAARMSELDLVRDADGRFRVNECYAHDSAWKDALAALIARSDVVLMDLRSFQARNAGCRYELGELARADHLERVVVLTDAQTDRATAQQEVALAPRGRFVWLDATRIDTATRRDVLESLFVARRDESHAVA